MDNIEKYINCMFHKLPMGQKANAETSAVLTFSSATETFCSHVPIAKFYSYNYADITREFTFSFFGNFSHEKFKVGDLFYNICVEITDDPTIKISGGVVSLGYYVHRFSLNNAKILSLNPLVVQTKYIDGIDVRISRPARRPQLSRHIDNYETIQESSKYLPLYEYGKKQRPFCWKKEMVGAFNVFMFYDGINSFVQYCMGTIDNEFIIWKENVVDTLSLSAPVDYIVIYHGNDMKKAIKIFKKEVKECML